MAPVGKIKYRNKLDLSIASAHWHEMTREVPGREKHVALRDENGKLVKDPKIGVVLARIDSSNELKLVPPAGVWESGVIVQIGKTTRWCLQHTTHWTYETVKKMHAHFTASAPYKKHLQLFLNCPIGLEMYRQAMPYYVVEAGPNEYSCPMHTSVEANRIAMCRRIAHIHKTSKCKGKCLDSAFYNMTRSSKAEKETLLCEACEVPELAVGGVAPVLWKQKCSDGVECKDCKFDAGGTDLRKKMPALPPCFKEAMNEQMEWSERRPEGDGKPLEEEEEEGE